jgi:hypothetical protein
VEAELQEHAPGREQVVRLREVLFAHARHAEQGILVLLVQRFLDRGLRPERVGGKRMGL